ncbi:MAG: hypothetical protein WAV90_10395 [Gordonia amarae]
MTGGERFEHLPEPEVPEALEQLAQSVRSQAAVLDDGWMLAVATFMVEDLYASYFTGLRMTPGVSAYLNATAGTFLDELAARGYVIDYVVDNTFGDADPESMLRHVLLTFHAAGFKVVGPQIEALIAMQRRGLRQEISTIPSFIAEGQRRAEERVRHWHAERRSTAYLNFDLDDGRPGLSLDAALSQRGKPGTIVVLRDQPPIIEPKVNVALPDGVTFP